VRFLVDEGLSPLVAQALRELGHEAEHVRDVGLGGKSDEAIIAYAVECGMVVITVDLDFPAILALTGATSPSVVTLRVGSLPVPEMGRLAVLAVTQLAEAIEKGAIISVSSQGARVRLLPIGESE
jgi:predicted nuclease of predicted toxin-antitoxin system